MLRADGLASRIATKGGGRRAQQVEAAHDASERAAKAEQIGMPGCRAARGAEQLDGLDPHALVASVAFPSANGFPRR